MHRLATLAMLAAALGGCAPDPAVEPTFALPAARLGAIRVVPCPAAVPAAARATSCPPPR